MSSKKWQIDRRTFVRGLGAAIALPMLEVMRPGVANAANGKTQRLVYIYLPNGISNPRGGSTTPPAYLIDAMADIKVDASFITGLKNANISDINGASHYVYWNPMWGGAATASDSTGATSALQRMTFDQLIAPLNVGSKIETLSMNAWPDTGPYNYTGIMANNASWKGPDKFVPSLFKPLDVFNQLFAGGVPQPDVNARLADQQKLKRGLLHYCMSDIKKVIGQGSASDRIRLDEYFDGLNSLDQRVAASAMPTNPTCVAPTGIGASNPTVDYPAHLKMFYDLVFTALKCDMTRVVSLMHCNESGDLRHKSFIPELRYDNTWHVFSHFGQPGYSEGSNGSLSDDPDANQRDYERLLIWHYTRIVEFVKRLKAEATPTGNLLDETLVAWGSCLGRSSDEHNRESLFWSLAGGGGGAFNRGLTVNNTTPVPLTNLWLTLMKGFGVNATQFGGGTLASTGEIPGLRKA